MIRLQNDRGVPFKSLVAPCIHVLCLLVPAIEDESSDLGKAFKTKPDQVTDSEQRLTNPLEPWAPDGSRDHSTTEEQSGSREEVRHQVIRDIDRFQKLDEIGARLQVPAVRVFSQQIGSGSHLFLLAAHKTTINGPVENFATFSTRRSTRQG